MLHLSGYEVKLDDLKNFRQLHSITPGHPEAGVTPGIEVTTGPLGQGIANAVGLAMAQAHMAAVYNKPGFDLFNNFTYVFCGDGCLQEGITQEAASLAGHLGLGRLIVLYDDNNITIDGETHLSFSEDIPKRFEALGWHSLTVTDGFDVNALEQAIESAKAVTDKPTIISVKTIIGFGSVNQGKEKTHGSPLGPEDIANVKEKFGFNKEEFFAIPDAVKDVYAKRASSGADTEAAWNATFEKYSTQFPTEAATIKRTFSRQLPENWEQTVPSFAADAKADATRNTSGSVLNAIAAIVPELVGGSADLTPSNKTSLKNTTDFLKESYSGRYFRFGVREHGMAAIGNGLYAYGSLIPFTATFLNFIEYCFPSVRLAALSHFQQIFIMTHDSIGVGEDGPTHQPIEAVALCRATPNLLTLRPADGNEVAGSYIEALKFKGPSVLCLTRQNIPSIPNSSAANVAKGAYVAVGSDDEKADVILIASGSEVSLALDAAKLLTGKTVRVVSIPSWELFDAQPVAYRRSVLTPGVPVVSIEVLSITGWERYAHKNIGMTTFGGSAPAHQLFEHFGFTPDKIATTVSEFLEGDVVEAKALAGGVGTLPVHFDSKAASKL